MSGSSGTRTVTKGVRDDNEILLEHDNETLSRCANCKKVFQGDDEKYTEIVGKYPKRQSFSKDEDRKIIRHGDGEKESNEIAIKEEGKGWGMTCQHGNEDGEYADSTMNDCTVGVLEAMLTIFGLPLVINGEKIDDSWWKSEGPCALCQNCHVVMSALYKTFQEYVRLGKETSYLSNCVKLLFENVGRTSAVPHHHGGGKEKRAAKEGNATPGHRKRGRPKRATVPESSFAVAPAEVTATESHAGDGENTDINWSLNVEFNEDSEHHHVQQPSPSRSDWGHDIDISNVVSVSAEVPSGAKIRTSPRARKVKLDPDPDFEEPTIRSRRIAAKNVKEIKKPKKYSIDDDEDETDETTKSTKSKTPSEMMSELWDIISEGPMYYNDTNLAKNTDGKYICPETNCPKVFTGLLLLNRHTLSHAMDRPYQCSKCSKEFKSLSAIKLHVKQIHMNNTLSEGAPRKKTTLSNSQVRLRSPGKSNTNTSVTPKNETFTCKHCEEHFLTEKSLEKHLATAHLEVTAQSRCAICEQLFPTVASLAKHLSSAHDKKHPCPHPDCYIKCGTHSDLEVHFENVHKQPMNLCKECGKSFTSPAYLHQHRISVHNLPAASVKEEATVDSDGTLLEACSPSDDDDEDPVGEPGERLKSTEEPVLDSTSSGPFKCPQCGKNFKRKHTLSVHLLFHNETEPQFGCSRCPKKYFQAKGLRRHLLGHTMANPLACTECEKVFVRRDHLKRHKDSVHCVNRPKKERKRKEKKPNRCTVCNKTYSRREYLSLHMRIHTGEKPFMCTICGKTFRDSRNYAQHCITHNNDRPFCCSICGLTFKRAHHLHDHEGTHRENIAKPFVCSIPDCGKAFRLKKHLVSHELVHTGSREHACHVCGKAFNRRDNLRQHINNVHGKALAEDVQKHLSQPNQSNLPPPNPGPDPLQQNSTATIEGNLPNDNFSAATLPSIKDDDIN